MSKINNSSESVRPTLAFYHANMKGTGTAVKFTLRPAHGTVDGGILMVIANQANATDVTQNPVYPHFDLENAVSVVLDFADLCKIIQVLRGEIESIEDGNGLYHVSLHATTKIVFRHMVDPVAGYSLEVSRFPRNGGEDKYYNFFLFPSEACGLCEALAGAMHRIAFGD